MKKNIILNSFDTDTLQNLANFNLTALYIYQKDVNTQNIELIKKILGNNVEVFVIFDVFYEKNAIEKHENCELIDSEGKVVLTDYICPTHEAYKLDKLNQISAIISNSYINGVVLDNIFYATYWMHPEPNIIDTCYCDRCLKKFSDYLGEPIEGADMEEKFLLIDGAYYFEWVNFKCAQICDFVVNVKKLLKSEQLLNVCLVPWDDSEHRAGIKRILSQDFDNISQHVDELSPMLYHNILNKPKSWVYEKLEYFSMFQKDVLPILYYKSNDDITEFLDLLKNILNNRYANGLCIKGIHDILKPDVKNIEQLTKLLNSV